MPGFCVHRGLLLLALRPNAAPVGQNTPQINAQLLHADGAVFTTSLQADNLRIRIFNRFSSASTDRTNFYTS